MKLSLEVRECRRWRWELCYRRGQLEFVLADLFFYLAAAHVLLLLS